MRKIIIVVMLMINLGFCNSITNEIVKQNIDAMIEKYAKKYKLEKAFIKAFCQQESQLKPYPIRYEEHKLKDKEYLKHIPEKYKKHKYSYCSLGLMQVLYGTASWLGFKKSPEDLILVENSLNYGCKYLMYLIRRYKRIDKVISSYNQGSPRKTGDQYNNQDYVNNVLRNYIKFGGKINVKDDIK